MLYNSTHTHIYIYVFMYIIFRIFVAWVDLRKKEFKVIQCDKHLRWVGKKKGKDASPDNEKKISIKVHKRHCPRQFVENEINKIFFPFVEKCKLWFVLIAFGCEI